jgi:hypothetical protein
MEPSLAALARLYCARVNHAAASAAFKAAYAADLEVSGEIERALTAAYIATPTIETLDAMNARSRLVMARQAALEEAERAQRQAVAAAPREEAA